MEIRIATKKIVNSEGKLCREILSVSGEGSETLPAEYLNEYPYCEFKKTGGESLVAQRGPSLTFRLAVGGEVEEERFQQLIKLLIDCGDTLARIRREHKEKKAAWNGDETFLI